MIQNSPTSGNFLVVGNVGASISLLLTVYGYSARSAALKMMNNVKDVDVAMTMMVKYCWRLHLAEIVITLLSGCWRFFREQTNIIWPVCNLFEGFWSNFCSHALVASLWEEVRGFCVADSPTWSEAQLQENIFQRTNLSLSLSLTQSLFHWITESDIPHC